MLAKFHISGLPIDMVKFRNPVFFILNIGISSTDEAASFALLSEYMYMPLRLAEIELKLYEK